MSGVQAIARFDLFGRNDVLAGSCEDALLGGNAAGYLLFSASAAMWEGVHGVPRFRLLSAGRLQPS